MDLNRHFPEEMEVEIEIKIEIVTRNELFDFISHQRNVIKSGYLIRKHFIPIKMALNKISMYVCVE